MCKVLMLKDFENNPEVSEDCDRISLGGFQERGVEELSQEEGFKGVEEGGADPWGG
jgi:hypothetical protein